LAEALRDAGPERLLDKIEQEALARYDDAKEGKA
jgi:hypothetical protein